MNFGSVCVSKYSKSIATGSRSKWYCDELLAPSLDGRELLDQMIAGKNSRRHVGALVSAEDGDGLVGDGVAGSATIPVGAFVQYDNLVWTVGRTGRVRIFPLQPPPDFEQLCSAPQAATALAMEMFR